jgi:ABC-type uncharacterized transport system auxiliary subunit
MNLRALMCLVLLSLVLSAAGCLSTGDGKEPESYYRVAIVAAPSDLDPVAVSVVFRPFSTDEILDREGILYQTSDVDRGYWSTHEWIEPVAGMVRSAMQRDFEQSGLFSSVLLFENEPLADIFVVAEIHEFGEVDGPDGWYGVLDMTMEANRVDTGELIWQSRVRHEEKAAKRTVAETVRALGLALGRASNELKAGIIGGVK